MFQVFFLRYVIGDTANLKNSVEEMDSTNGKAPAKIETLLKMWKKYKAESEEDVTGEELYSRFFSAIGAENLFYEFKLDQKNDVGENLWILNNVQRAHMKGPRYGAPRREQPREFY